MLSISMFKPCRFLVNGKWVFDWRFSSCGSQFSPSTSSDSSYSSSDYSTFLGVTVEFQLSQFKSTLNSSSFTLSPSTWNDEEESDMDFSVVCTNSSFQSSDSWVGEWNYFTISKFYLEDLKGLISHSHSMSISFLGFYKLIFWGHFWNF